MNAGRACRDLTNEKGREVSTSSTRLSEVSTSSTRESEVSTSSTRGADGGSTRLVRDSGGGVSGPLAVITMWQHTMAVAPAPDGKTLFRDELKFEAGPLTLLLWPMFWAFWQWRALAMRRLAPRWRV